ncbi:MAG: aminotransferase class III-fold pyridoxal phosphate-dependent enzyme [Calditerrivibrio sp.]|nr:aminotransferase class III-fold pyridoxal phosphate-dependent enzyme [Calditerrivibrio sp.]
MKKIYEEYKLRFSKSKNIFKRYQAVFPKGVSHDIRFFTPFPFIVKSSKGPKITTIDDIELIDLWMGHYTNILGHANTSIIDEIKEVSRKGIQMGILNEYQLLLAEKIKEAVPEMETMRFCTSGTEATMYATRVAKSYTKRDIVAKIEGGWHGGNTDLSFDIKPPYKGMKENIISLPFNDTTTSLDILSKIKGNLAAIILEPILGAGGGVKAEEEFLKEIRAFCDKNGTLLIYDETITGFRFRFGSIWPIFGVKPDLFTFGKIVGGGFAIGVYGGKKDIMDVIKKGEIITGGGTFSEHILSMAAGYKTLSLLEKKDYNRLNNKGEKLKKTIEGFIPKNINAFVSGYGSLLSIHFLTRGDIQKNKPSSFLSYLDYEKESLFKIAMILNGVYTMHSGGCITFAHKKTDINQIILAYKNSFEALADG